MKQRFIALLLAVCIACTMLVVPASGKQRQHGGARLR